MSLSFEDTRPLRFGEGLGRYSLVRHLATGSIAVGRLLAIGAKLEAVGPMPVAPAPSVAAPTEDPRSYCPPQTRLLRARSSTRLRLPDGNSNCNC